MPFPKRLIVALVLATATAAFAAPTSTAQQAAGSAQCENRETPPPPVDTSEQPAPGQKAPAALEVPEKPIGGDRLGECGLILPPNSGQPPGGINAATWLIADLDSGDVLAAKDPHARERPASLIKNLLAIVVIRSCAGRPGRRHRRRTPTRKAPRSVIGPGGQYTVDQLLHALIMHSGNDAAWALARAARRGGRARWRR